MNLDRAHHVLSYDPDTGLLIWRCRINSRAVAGSVAGHFTKADGYIRVRVDGFLYLGHRVAWLLHYGAWPTLMLDHVNGVRNDNRIANLREATHSQQIANSIGFSKRRLPKGVWHSGNRFTARIQLDGVPRYLGSFANAELAHSAYCEAGNKYYGEFFCNGVRKS